VRTIRNTQIPVLCVHTAKFYCCNGVDQRIARQRLPKHGPISNSRTTGLWNPFLDNGSVNILLRRCKYVTAAAGNCHVTCVFCRQQPARQWIDEIANTWHVFSVWSVPRSYLEDIRHHNAVDRIRQKSWSQPWEFRSWRRIRNRPVKNKHVIWRCYVCCSTMILGLCDLVRLL
jgi:hypothetical protein